jgi:hypothetical protein
MLIDTADLPQLTPKWSGLPQLYSGPALVIRSADAADWTSARVHELFIVVANTIVCRAGSDWPSLRAADGER